VAGPRDEGATELPPGDGAPFLFYAIHKTPAPEAAGQERAVVINDWAWLHGRELLVSEIKCRVEELRNSVLGTRAERGLNVGLLVYLERRLARMQGALGELSDVPTTACHDLRQTLDRMVSGAAATLWHAESKVLR
jgi:hypothetical protein